MVERGRHELPSISDHISSSSRKIDSIAGITSSLPKSPISLFKSFQQPINNLTPGPMPPLEEDAGARTDAAADCSARPTQQMQQELHMLHMVVAEVDFVGVSGSDELLPGR